MNLLARLRQQFQVAVGTLTAEPGNLAELVFESQQPEFGDYQFNGAMGLGKLTGGKPRDVAAAVVKALPAPELFAKVDIAGPGFINLKLADGFLAKSMGELAADPNLGVEPTGAGRTIVVDYSSPNVAKPLHVGHLRSTIIGDAIANTHARLGWKVIRDNHLGDWGTQFGMLIYGWRNHRDDAAAKANPVGELARLYRLVNKRIEGDTANGIPADEGVAKAARLETAKLHEGDPENTALWNVFMPWCLADLERNYAKLGIRFDTYHGESFYNPLLPGVVEQLTAAGVATLDQGSMAVFFPDPSGKVDEHGRPVQRFAPMIVRKADGAFTYATSDLACIAWRMKEYAPAIVAYVVDDRQSLHFQQLFEVAGRLHPNLPKLVHVPFGKIMGQDGRPWKTREGGTVALEELLDEAIATAGSVIRENLKELSDEEQAAAARAIGIGAVKYIDLMQNRTSDYIFDLAKMVQLQGNTAAYLQYVVARIRSIFRKGKIDPASLRSPEPIGLEHSKERALALRLLRYPELLEQSAGDMKPNILCGHLFALANAYNSFYHDCPVLTAETAERKRDRLKLCDLTARSLADGLSLLGIETVERM